MREPASRSRSSCRALRAHVADDDRVRLLLRGAPPAPGLVVPEPHVQLLQLRGRLRQLQGQLRAQGLLRTSEDGGLPVSNAVKTKHVKQDQVEHLCSGSRGCLLLAIPRGRR